MSDRNGDDHRADRTGRDRDEPPQHPLSPPDYRPRFGRSRAIQGVLVVLLVAVAVFLIALAVS